MTSKSLTFSFILSFSFYSLIAQTILEPINPSFGADYIQGFSCNDEGICLGNRYASSVISNDWGLNWSLNDYNFKLFSKINEEVYFFLDDRGKLLNSTNGGVSIDSINDLNLTHGSPQFMHFFNIDTGLIQTYGILSDTLLITYDGGLEWTSLSTSPEGGIASNRAMKVLKDRSIIYDNYDKLYQSTDLGSTWNLICTNSPGLADFHQVSDSIFYNSRVFVGSSFPFSNHLLFFKSYNGGQTWSVDTIRFSHYNYPENYSTIEWVNRDTGYFSTWVNGIDSTIFHKTINGGKSWESFKFEAIENAGKPVIYFRSAERGIIAFNHGVFHVTFDGGQTWTRTYQSCTFNNLNRIEKINSNNHKVMIGDKGTLLILGQEGLSKIDIPTEDDLIDIESGFDSVIIVISKNGKVLRSSDYGYTWSLSEQLNFNPRDLFIDDSVSLICGTEGNIIASNDEGQTWVDISPQFSNPEGYEIGAINRTFNGDLCFVGHPLSDEWGNSLTYGFSADGTNWSFETKGDFAPEYGIRSDLVNLPSGGMIFHNGIQWFRNITAGPTWESWQELDTAIHPIGRRIHILPNDDLLVYKGTPCPGQFYISKDEGDSWELLTVINKLGSCARDFLIDQTDTITVGSVGSVSSTTEASGCEATSSLAVVDSVELKVSVANGTKEKKTQSLSIYPNPTTGHLKVSLSHPIRSIRVFDLMGRVVYIQQSGKPVIDISNLDSGYYILEVVTTSDIFSTKISKIDK